MSDLWFSSLECPAPAHKGERRDQFDEVRKRYAEIGGTLTDDMLQRTDPELVCAVLANRKFIIGNQEKSQPYCHGHLSKDIAEMNARWLLLQRVPATEVATSKDTGLCTVLPALLDSLDTLFSRQTASAGTDWTRQHFHNILKEQTRDIFDWLYDLKDAHSRLGGWLSLRVWHTTVHWPEASAAREESERVRPSPVHGKSVHNASLG